MIKNLKAILFDFDGVLADTMEDNFTAWKMAFKNKNVEIERGDYFPLEGLKIPMVAKTIGLKYGIDEKDYPEIIEFKNKYYLENHFFSFYPNVKETVEYIKKKGLKIAIVTASNRERLEKTVPRNFLKKFDAVISGDDCINGKPHPEPYLNAMRMLNVYGRKSLVVENAPLGIQSAMAAGAHCLAITTTLEKEYLQDADKIFKNIGEIKEYLKLSIGK